MYDADYLKTGSGRVVHQMRKVMSLIQAVSNPRTPVPSISGYGDLEDIKTFGGWIAAWGDPLDTNTGMLYLDYDNDGLVIYSTKPNDPDVSSQIDMYYEFDEVDGDWSKFDEAVHAARQWLVDNADGLVANDPVSLHKLFRLDAPNV